jgi:CTP:molybdopterin cytidylyltransferase MocA
MNMKITKVAAIIVAAGDSQRIGLIKGAGMIITGFPLEFTPYTDTGRE